MSNDRTLDKKIMLEQLQNMIKVLESMPEKNSIDESSPPPIPSNEKKYKVDIKKFQKKAVSIPTGKKEIPFSEKLDNFNEKKDEFDFSEDLKKIQANEHEDSHWPKVSKEELDEEVVRQKKFSPKRWILVIVGLMFLLLLIMTWLIYEHEIGSRLKKLIFKGQENVSLLSNKIDSINQHIDDLSKKYETLEAQKDKNSKDIEKLSAEAEALAEKMNSNEQNIEKVSVIAEKTSASMRTSNSSLSSKNENLNIQLKKMSELANKTAIENIENKKIILKNNENLIKQSQEIEIQKQINEKNMHQINDLIKKVESLSIELKNQKAVRPKVNIQN